MPELHLSTVTRTQGANTALKDGSVRPRGAVFDFVEVPVLVQAFRRMVRQREFDVCEMAFTTYLVAREHGARFTALPIFLVRGFHHGAIRYDRTAGTVAPKDIEGRRVGVERGYTVTTGVWARGVLADEYGVDLDRVTWVLSGDEHVAQYRPPANVVSAPAGSDLVAMMAGGDLVAAIGVNAEHPDLVPLIPNPERAALDALHRDGFSPINHLLVVKDELLAARPGLDEAVFDAFVEAKNLYVDRLRADDIADPTAADRMYADILRETGRDPLPYGITPNRAAVERLLDHAVGQRILDRRPAVESLFAAGTHGLV